MYNVGIALFPGAHLFSISGLLDIFHTANDHARRLQGTHDLQFSCRTVAISCDPVRTSSGIALKPDCTIADTNAFDLIYIPSFFYEGFMPFKEMAASQSELMLWFSDMWKQGHTVAANCTGTLLLAESGILDHHRATTSWWLEDAFKRQFPAVNLDTSALLAEDERLMTTGALTALLNLAIHLIGRHAGPHLAAVCAKTMLIDTGSESQRPYQDLLANELSADPLVSKAQYWMQNSLGEAMSQEDLAARLNVTQQTLTRRFKSELNTTPFAYLQNLRLEAAKQMLGNSKAPIAEIVEKVGYSDMSSFVRLFKRKTGLTPTAYRQKFNIRHEVSQP